MSDPVMVCVAVILKEEDPRRDTGFLIAKDAPHRIGYGYEDNNAWGAGQDTDWQNTSWDDNAPKYGKEGYEEWYEERHRYIYGYEVASTWNGVIVFNDALHRAIEKKTRELREWFPNATIETIVRGKQN